MSLANNSSWTHAVQWLERSLDDSSNRRLVIPEAFLTADAICDSMYRLVSGFRVDDKLIGRNLGRYRMMFETEAQMMEGTLKGGSRQKLHEEIRRQSLSGVLNSTQSASKWKLSGAASEQASRFVKSILRPTLQRELKKFSDTSEDIFKRQSV
jgi:adenylosuccinate lyase